MSNYEGDKIPSPSGKYYLISTVNRTDKSKDYYAEVIIYLYSSNGQQKSKLRTHAGDFSKWAIGWDTENDTVIMYSSDIGSFAWRIENDQLKAIDVTDSLKRRADKLKQEKYH